MPFVSFMSFRCKFRNKCEFGFVLNLSYQLASAAALMELSMPRHV
jgi:hypothetical protein